MPRSSTAKVRVYAPYSRSPAVRDQALFYDKSAKTCRQEPVGCIQALSLLADVCYNAPRLEDTPKSFPSDAGDETNLIGTATAAVQADAPRRSARVAANAEKQQQQSSSLSDPSSRTSGMPIATQPADQRKRERLNQEALTNEHRRVEVQRVASHTSDKDERRDNPVARRHLGPLMVRPIPLYLVPVLLFPPPVLTFTARAPHVGYRNQQVKRAESR